MRFALAAMTSVALASCGAPADQTTDAPTGATTLATYPDATGTYPIASTLVPPGSSPTAVDPATACPRSDPSAIFSDEGEMMEGSAMAERNLGVINRYVAANPEVSTQPFLDWSADPPRVVIGFTGDLAPHRAALEPLLADPERVLICSVAFNSAQISAVATEIQQQMTAGGPMVGVFGGTSAVEVQLAAYGEDFAAQLVATYGDIVKVRVGLFPYPMTDELAASTEPDPACASDISGPIDMSGLRAEVRLASNALAQGTDTDGKVVFTNTGTADVSFESGDPLTGVVVMPGTTDVVGTFTGVLAGTGAGAVLAPGESTEVGLVVGTASCIPANGFMLPPGEYEVVVVAVVDYLQQPPVNRLVSIPAPLVVIAP